MARQRALPQQQQMEAALVDLFSNLWSPSTPSLPLPSPFPPPLPQTHPNPPQPSQDHTPEGTLTLQRHLFLACLPAYDICDPSPGTPSCRVLPRPKLCCPLLPIVALLGSHPPSARPSPSPVHFPRLSGAGSSPQCCLGGSPGRIRAWLLPLPKKQATDKTSTTSKRARSLAFFFLSTRETQKGRRPRVRSFLTSRSLPTPSPSPSPSTRYVLYLGAWPPGFRSPLSARSRAAAAAGGIASPSTCGVEKGQREQCTRRISRISPSVSPQARSGTNQRPEKPTT